MTDTEAFVDQGTDRAPVATQERPPRATAGSFKNKKERRRELTFTLDPDAGAVSILLVSIGRPAYDKMQADHPPTPKQLRRNEDVNQDTFVPALLSAVVREPQMSVEDWTEIFSSPFWSAGEMASLFYECNQLCREGIDLAPFDNG